MAAEFLGLTVYLWIALISLVFLILFSVTGHYGVDMGHDVDVGVDHDYGQFSGSGISPLSPPLVSAFGTTFGSIGALLEIAGFTPFLVAVSAAIAAVVVAFGLFYTIQRFLVRAQASSDVVPETLIGREANVTIPIAPGQQGQILIITEERGRSLFPAISREDIARDSIVEILGFAGGIASVRKKLG